MKTCNWKMNTIYSFTKHHIPVHTDIPHPWRLRTPSVWALPPPPAHRCSGCPSPVSRMAWWRMTSHPWPASCAPTGDAPPCRQGQGWHSTADWSVLWWEWPPRPATGRGSEHGSNICYHILGMTEASQVMKNVRTSSCIRLKLHYEVPTL